MNKYLLFIFLFFLADSSFAQFKIDVDKKVVDEFFKKKTISDLKIGEEGFVQLGYAYLCMTENRQFLFVVACKREISASLPGPASGRNRLGR